MDNSQRFCTARWLWHLVRSDYHLVPAPQVATYQEVLLHCRAGTIRHTQATRMPSGKRKLYYERLPTCQTRPAKRLEQQFGQLNREIERLVDAMPKGDPAVLGPRSISLDAERKRISEELQNEPPPKAVALHPAILKWHEKQLLWPKTALRRSVSAGYRSCGDNPGSGRDSCSVERPTGPGGVAVEIAGRPNALLGQEADPNRERSAGKGGGGGALAPFSRLAKSTISHPILRVRQLVSPWVRGALHSWRNVENPRTAHRVKATYSAKNRRRIARGTGNSPRRNRTFATQLVELPLHQPRPRTASTPGPFASSRALDLGASCLKACCDRHPSTPRRNKRARLEVS
jgi:hypothetical protein